ncbi:MAG: hypothetical protein HW380_3856 [Magnetococcales bacterium]|nr:hypothetical protein [Magnetococcales bacterium]HIJ83750.1 hypothetical protein [Magnetococcales bacterium]
MFNAIPATTALGGSNPMIQQTALANVSQNIRTNNQEQLEAKHVASLKETRQARRLRDETADEDRNAGDDPSESRASALSSMIKRGQDQVVETTHAVSSFLLSVAAGSPQADGKPEETQVPNKPSSPKSIDVIA